MVGSHLVVNIKFKNQQKLFIIQITKWETYMESIICHYVLVKNPTSSKLNVLRCVPTYKCSARVCLRS